MANYKLINPSIQGDLKNVVAAGAPLDAAKQIWTNLSKYITNNVPSFAFTIENQDGGSIHHFKVEETKHKNEARFEIKQLDLKLKASDLKKFKERVSKSSMAGGKKHKHHKKDDDDDSSSSSSSDGFDTLKLYKNFSRPILPITYWWYDPYVYNLQSVYIPTFITPVLPYIEIATVSYYSY